VQKGRVLMLNVREREDLNLQAKCETGTCDQWNSGSSHFGDRSCHSWSILSKLSRQAESSSSFASCHYLVAVLCHRIALNLPKAVSSGREASVCSLPVLV
jgi:hypothetical protein